MRCLLRGGERAVAIAIPDEIVGSRIKAVVAFHDGSTMTAPELQQYCGTRIPRYMIPEAIEFRPHLPKTSTGKWIECNWRRRAR